VGEIAMHVKRMACWGLLIATVLISGCNDDHTIVGRWDMGRSNFYFRRDGVVFYLTTARTRYSGRWYYDDSTDPGKLVADMTEINGGGNPLRLEMQVKFLSADRVQFVGTNGGQRRASVASRMPEDMSSSDPQSQSDQ